MQMFERCGALLFRTLELVCILIGRTSVTCGWEGSLINFWSPSSCYCPSGCEMWQNHGQWCNAGICCISNSFLPSTPLCELRGFDWQWSGGLNHILNLPEEDLLDFCSPQRHCARGYLQRGHKSIESLLSILRVCLWKDNYQYELEYR